MSTASCYVLDVGQGMSSIVVLPGGRTLVIDGGPRPEVALRLMHSLGVQMSIEAMVVSHNDRDHAWGAVGVVKQHFAQLKRLYFLQDRDPKSIGWLNELLDSLSAEQQDELPGKVRCLVTGDAKLRLWPEGKPRREQDPQLTLLFPTFWDNQVAQRGSSDNASNATSGVLELRWDGSAVLFPGDAPIAVWRQLNKRYGRLRCEVLVFPHHGARVENADLEWLLKEAIECRRLVVFSVGTHNGYGHPDEGVVRAARRLGGGVACTQVTSKCCPDPASAVPGLLPEIRYRDRPSRCSMTGTRASGTGCMGTVKIGLEPTGVLIDGLQEHQQRVDDSPGKGWSPLCR